MDELDRYLYEINRIQKNVNLYHDLFCIEKNRNTLNYFSVEVFSVFQKSMNTEIILSVAKAFDGDGYKNNGKTLEYLSQYNLAKKYECHINSKLKELQNKTTKTCEKLNFKNYRNIVLAHNDKLTMLGEQEVEKHLVDTDILLELLSASYNFIYELRLIVFGIEPKDTVSRQTKYTSRSSSDHFIKRLQNM